MYAHTWTDKQIAVVAIVGIGLIFWGASVVRTGLGAVSGHSGTVTATQTPTQEPVAPVVTPEPTQAPVTAPEPVVTLIDPAAVPAAVKPAVKTTDQILHETLDPLAVDWGMGCGDVGTALGVTIWTYTLDSTNNSLASSAIKICFRSDLPATVAHFTALHEYAHVLQMHVAAAQTPVLSMIQLEARVSGLFDPDPNLRIINPDLWDPHLEILADCSALIMNGGVWGNTSYTHDCSGVRGTAAAAILEGVLPS